MKQSTIVVILLFSPGFLLAQEFAGEFGELAQAATNRALLMKTYSNDTSASALLLYDVGRVEVVPIGTKLTYLRRVKIFNKSAYADWANVEIYVQKLGFTKIKGFTYNLENGVVIKTPLDESQIFKSSYDKEWDKYIFTMPNVKEGTVIEYSWKTTVDFYTLPDWRFQHSVPVVWSQYDLDNSIVSFRSDIAGSLKINYDTPKGRKNIYKWSTANVPAFKKESHMPNDDLFRSQLNLWSYSPSWQKAVQRLRDHKYFNANVIDKDFLFPIAEENSGGLAQPPRERIKNLVGYVKTKLAWNGTHDYLSDNPKDVLKLKRGSSGDINLMLISLLSKAGITVTPVLISTRENGHYHEDIPSLQQFNYLICQAIIGSDTLYVDATESGLRYDALPLRCLNQRGLSITADSALWVPIRPKFKHKITAEADFILEKSGELKGKLTITRDGYAAHTSRQSYFSDKEKFYLTSINGAWQVNEKHYENEKEPEKPFLESYDLTIDTHSNIAGDLIYVNPFLSLVEESNPFHENNRRYPIEYEVPEEKTFVGKISIPAGYAIQEIPTSKVIAIPGNGIRCVFNFSQVGDQVQILTRLQINRTHFDSEEFEGLREFYARVVAKKAEQIVLRKL